MISPGEIHLADLHEERRRKVLVISNERFHRVSTQVVVAPMISRDADDAGDPWRIVVDGDVFSVDRMRSVRADRLLELISKAPAMKLAQARRAVRAIM